MAFGALLIAGKFFPRIYSLLRRTIYNPTNMRYAKNHQDFWPFAKKKLMIFGKWQKKTISDSWYGVYYSTIAYHRK